MLNMTIDIGDYIAIGNDVRIKYKRAHGNDDKFVVSIIAPAGAHVMSSTEYEDGVDELAKNGDDYAQMMSRVLKDDKDVRRALVAENKAQGIKRK
jgi:hypothetical protein